MNNYMPHAFLINQIGILLILFGTVMCEGAMVVYLGIKVNYTRKLNHLFVFITPFFLRDLLPYPEDTAKLLMGPVICLLTFLVYVKPVRSRLWIVRLMYSAFDRPEDRPHTLRWLVTQYGATYLVAIPLYFYFKSVGMSFLLLIIILINAIGDGLAEPVGIRFGRHPYRVKAVFTGKEYTRSLEGSACVYLSAIGVLLYYAASLTAPELVMSLLLLPPIVTLAEAVSPHTWDSPFIFLSGGLVLIFVTRIF